MPPWRPPVIPHPNRPAGPLSAAQMAKRTAVQAARVADRKKAMMSDRKKAEAEAARDAARNHRTRKAGR